MAARIVFMGSPEFSLPILENLSNNYPVVGVITQPDRPAGRGRALLPPPVKVKALELGIPVIQPEKLRDPNAFQTLIRWMPEVIVVAAYGQILRQNVLDLPPAGCINVHASLLPRWRGASPIQFSILEGDERTGVTIMRMDAGLDTGPVLAKTSIPIQPDDTAGTLSSKLAGQGAALLLETLPGYLSGTISPCAQDELQATYARLLRKEDGLLDFSLPAEQLARKVRAFNPWPGAYLVWRGQPLKVLRAHVDKPSRKAVPGKLYMYGKKPYVDTVEGALALDEVQPSGKKAMSGEVFLNGAKDWETD